MATFDQAVSAFFSAQVMSRDRTAVGQGLRVAPHQEIIASVIHIKAPFQAAAYLAKLCSRAARHFIRTLPGGGDDAQAPTGRRVVIGHGRSPLWRELEDFVTNRLGLEVDEFNQVPTAGVTTAARLAEMAAGASMALLVATAGARPPWHGVAEESAGSPSGRRRA